ncbi:MAG TPA: nucleoside-diphosphate kinase [Candidatus Saccharimonadales bacterium]|nr:nucleoside-diphosphate kinase [Candidatus Saccharimonadales bacterium]
MQRTLVVLKPDAVARGIAGEIMSRFERAGLKIIGLKMVGPDEEHFHHHYENIGQLISRRGEDVYRRNADFMMSGPVIAIVLEGVEAVSTVRKMVGETEPHKAQPGTIRGDYAHMTIEHANEKGGGLPNLIHASADPEEAKQEVDHWFKAEELHEYKTAHQHLTQ